jgi:hypothetical protein
MFIHPENQTLVWNIINQNEKFSSMPLKTREHMFKTAFSEIYHFSLSAFENSSRGLSERSADNDQNWKIDGRSQNDSRLKILRSATNENLAAYGEKYKIMNDKSKINELNKMVILYIKHNYLMDYPSQSWKIAGNSKNGRQLKILRSATEENSFLSGEYQSSVPYERNSNIHVDTILRDLPERSAGKDPFSAAGGGESLNKREQNIFPYLIVDKMNEIDKTKPVIDKVEDKPIQNIEELIEKQKAEREQEYWNPPSQAAENWSLPTLLSGEFSKSTNEGFRHSEAEVKTHFPELVKENDEVTPLKPSEKQNRLHDIIEEKINKYLEEFLEKKMDEIFEKKYEMKIRDYSQRNSEEVVDVDVDVDKSIDSHENFQIKT